MYPKPTHPVRLEGWERECAYLAHQACTDTVYGGAAAVARVKDLKLADPAHALEYDAAVSETYARSTGKPANAYRAWECGECGCAYLGREAAAECCGDEC